MKQNKKPLLILHIGIEKTGTTTIQEFLHLNRNLLADNGYFIPKSIGVRNHRPLASWCLDPERMDDYLKIINADDPQTRKQWRGALLDNFNNELGQLKNDINAVLISSEHFSFLLNKPEEIKRLSDILHNWFDRISIIVYLRRQDKLATSLYNVSLRAGIRNAKIIPPLNQNPHFFFFYRMLNNWSSIFGKESIHPLIFDNQVFYGKTLLSDFIYHTKLPSDLNYKIPENMNISYSKNAQELVHIFNNHFSESNGEKPEFNFRQLRIKLLEEFSLLYPGSPKMPTRNEALKFYSIFKKSNKEVAREWFSKESLFTEDFSMYPEEKDNPDFDIKLIDTAFRIFSDYFRIKGYL